MTEYFWVDMILNYASCNFYFDFIFKIFQFIFQNNLIIIYQEIKINIKLTLKFRGHNVLILNTTKWKYLSKISLRISLFFGSSWFHWTLDLHSVMYIWKEWKNLPKFIILFRYLYPYWIETNPYCEGKSLMTSQICLRDFQILKS